MAERAHNCRSSLYVALSRHWTFVVHIIAKSLYVPRCGDLHEFPQWMSLNKRGLPLGGYREAVEPDGEFCVPQVFPCVIWAPIVFFIVYIYCITLCTSPVRQSAHEATKYANVYLGCWLGEIKDGKPSSRGRYVCARAQVSGRV